MAQEHPERVYTNAVQFYGGPFDITLDLGYRPASDVEPEMLVKVTMSWEHARVLHEILGRLVDDYESKVGLIPRLVESVQEKTS